MSSTLRRRRHVANIIQDLDAFPKIPETIREDKRFTGGAIAVVCFTLISWLVIGELLDYLSPSYHYTFEVDTEFNQKLDLNVDMTVATSCMGVSADVIDSADTALRTEGKLELQATRFNMNVKHAQYWNLLKSVADSQASQETGARNNPLESLTWFSEHVRNELRRENENEARTPGKRDACRIHGSLQVNKIAGNLHVTAGKSIGLGGSHLHINIIFPDSEPQNFSHRIEKLSFCSDHQNIVNTLDATEKISTDVFFWSRSISRLLSDPGRAPQLALEVFQYYIKVVPTKVLHSTGVVTTCQYAVTERRRLISHSSGSHGMPGIFFKYDLSPLSINVLENRPPLWRFTVRLCAIIGGIYATSGVLNLLLSLVLSLVTCRCSKYAQQSDAYEKRRLSAEEWLHAHENASSSSLAHNGKGPSDHSLGSTFVT